MSHDFRSIGSAFRRLVEAIGTRADETPRQTLGPGYAVRAVLRQGPAGARYAILPGSEHRPRLASSTFPQRLKSFCPQSVDNGFSDGRFVFDHEDHLTLL